MKSNKGGEKPKWPSKWKIWETGTKFDSSLEGLGSFEAIFFSINVIVGGD